MTKIVISILGARIVILCIPTVYCIGVGTSGSGLEEKGDLM